MPPWMGVGPSALSFAAYARPRPENGRRYRSAIGLNTTGSTDRRIEVRDVEGGPWVLGVGKRVDFARKRTVAFFGLKITLALSTRWKGQKSHKATIQRLCCQL
jgi:hypothetical protein